MLAKNWWTRKRIALVVGLLVLNVFANPPAGAAAVVGSIFGTLLLAWGIVWVGEYISRHGASPGSEQADG